MKRLELEVVRKMESPNGPFVVFRIKKQTHYGLYFGNNSYRFVATNGITLLSLGDPAFPVKRKKKTRTLYVSGSPDCATFTSIYVSGETFTKIEEAVAEYNEWYSDRDPMGLPRDPDTPEIQVFKACVSYPHAAGGYRVVELLMIGAETEEEARQLVKEAMTTSTCTIEIIPKTTAKEKGILHRSVMTVI